MAGKDDRGEHKKAEAVKNHELKKKRDPQMPIINGQESPDGSKLTHRPGTQLKLEGHIQANHSGRDEGLISQSKRVSHEEIRKPRQGMKGIAALRPPADSDRTSDRGRSREHESDSDESADSFVTDEDEDNEDDAARNQARSSPRTHHSDSRSRMELVRNQGRPASSMQYLTRKVQAFDKAERLKDEFD